MRHEIARSRDMLIGKYLLHFLDYIVLIQLFLMQSSAGMRINKLYLYPNGT